MTCFHLLQLLQTSLLLCHSFLSLSSSLLRSPADVFTFRRLTFCLQGATAQTPTLRFPGRSDGSGGSRRRVPPSLEPTSGKRTGPKSHREEREADPWRALSSRFSTGLSVVHHILPPPPSSAEFSEAVWDSVLLSSSVTSAVDSSCASAWLTEGTSTLRLWAFFTEQLKVSSYQMRPFTCRPPPPGCRCASSSAAAPLCRVSEEGSAVFRRATVRN